MPKKITIELSEETAYRLQRLEESFKKHSGFTKKQTRNFLIDGWVEVEWCGLPKDEQ